MKYQIVKFEKGRYGIRRRHWGFLWWKYRSLKSNLWWSYHSDAMQFCAGSKEEIVSLYNKLCRSPEIVTITELEKELMK